MSSCFRNVIFGDFPTYHFPGVRNHTRTEKFEWKIFDELRGQFGIFVCAFIDNQLTNAGEKRKNHIGSDMQDIWLFVLHLYAVVIFLVKCDVFQYLEDNYGRSA